MRRSLCLGLCAGLLALSAAARADDKKDADAVTLKVVAKKDKYAFDAGGKTPKEFKKELEDVAAAMKKNPRPAVKLPAPPAVDLVLQVTNNGKEEVTVYVGGDPNVYTLELKGPGVMTLPNDGPMTLEFRVPKAVKLGPGKSYDIPLSVLRDGQRGVARNVYWTEPGEYTLTATYQLSDAKGEKGPLLKSEAVTIKVTEKK